MELTIQLIRDHWLLIIGACILIFLLIKLVRLTVKLALIAAVIIGAYLLITNQELPQDIDEAKMIVTDLKDEVTDKVTDKVQSETMEKLVEAVEGAEYQKENDGDFKIKYKDIEATGNEDSEFVTININGETYTMTKSEALEQVKTYMTK